MLQDFERGGAVMNAVPYYADYQRKLNMMTPQERADLFAYADAEIAKAVAAKVKMCCSSWMCKKDWWGTPLWPIFMSVANQSEAQAGMFWGLVVKDRIINRAASTGEHWGCIHTDYPNARGLTYWIIW